MMAKTNKELVIQVLENAYPKGMKPAAIGAMLPDLDLKARSNTLFNLKKDGILVLDRDSGEYSLRTAPDSYNRQLVAQGGRAPEPAPGKPTPILSTWPKTQAAREQKTQRSAPMDQTPVKQPANKPAAEKPGHLASVPAPEKPTEKPPTKVASLVTDRPPMTLGTAAAYIRQTLHGDVELHITSAGIQLTMAGQRYDAGTMSDQALTDFIASAAWLSQHRVEEAQHG